MMPSLVIVSNPLYTEIVLSDVLTHESLSDFGG